jgi:hypothetical protein
MRASASTRLGVSKATLRLYRLGDLRVPSKVSINVMSGLLTSTHTIKKRALSRKMGGLDGAPRWSLEAQRSPH